MPHSAIRFTRTVGRFNLMNPSEESAAYTFYLPEGAPKRTFSTTVEPGSFYDYEHTDDPWEAIDGIERYLNERILYSSQKSIILECIQWMRDNEAEQRVYWWEERLEREQKKLRDQQETVDRVARALEIARSELDPDV